MYEPIIESGVSRVLLARSVGVTAEVRLIAGILRVAFGGLMVVAKAESPTKKDGRVIAKKANVVIIMVRRDQKKGLNLLYNLMIVILYQNGCVCGRD